MDGSLCRHALGIMMERLPGATDESIEKSIKNLENVERKGLRTYLDRPIDSDTQSESPPEPSNSLFRSFEPVLGRMLDDCFEDMGESFRYSKTPLYRCSCSMDRIWRTLSILPKEELLDIIESGEPLEVNILKMVV